jgi:glycyl-tRNA synthetase
LESILSAHELCGLSGVAGLYDYGPPGSSLQANIIAEWRKHFIVEDHMLELDTTIMTPASVFETSGHVARFADWMVKDSETGDVLRADHLVKNVLEARIAGDQEARGFAAQVVQEDDKKKKKKDKVKEKNAPVQLPDDVVREYERTLAKVCLVLILSILTCLIVFGQLDDFSGPELGDICQKFAIKNPDTNNEVTEPQQFNLMFASSIGPTGQHPGCVVELDLRTSLIDDQVSSSGNGTRPFPEFLSFARV